MNAAQPLPDERAQRLAEAERFLSILDAEADTPVSIGLGAGRTAVQYPCRP
ncbi:MAG: hypothetical protein N838_28850 [Thiohalocapsa sp. PB-PSB1]|nr:MAG: hypothetical protein N838_28850 [Thiohalocapsa sp. PB-PSB1]